MITATTISSIRTFCKPALDTGLIDPAQFAELVKLARQTTGAPEPPEKGAALLTVADVADLFKCSGKTVHRMRADGRLTGLFLSPSRKSLRFRRRDVEAFLEGRAGQ